MPRKTPRKEHQNSTDDDKRILVISEDLESFPSYFEKVLKDKFKFGSGPKPELSKKVRGFL